MPFCQVIAAIVLCQCLDWHWVVGVLITWQLWLELKPK